MFNGINLNYQKLLRGAAAVFQLKNCAIKKGLFLSEQTLLSTKLSTKKLNLIIVLQFLLTVFSLLLF